MPVSLILGIAQIVVRQAGTFPATDTYPGADVYPGGDYGPVLGTPTPQTLTLTGAP